MFDLVIRNTSCVVTCRGTPKEDAEEALGLIPHGAVAISNGLISWLGTEDDLPNKNVGTQTRVLDARGNMVGPGFIDAHTHLVFAGDRSHEFALRNRGASYLDIAKAGGGIMSTVRATRAASEDALVEAALPRLQRMLAQGITHVEVKSGYGLNVTDELKMLRAIRRLESISPVSISATLLCAHAIPEEFKDNRSGYLQLCLDELIPEVAKQGLARFFDVFVEEGAFTHDEAFTLIECAQRHGLVPRLHVDQLTHENGALLAAKVQAASADHLETISEDGIFALAQNGVSAVLAPLSSLFLHSKRFAPGRKLRDAGVNVAVASNFNPGSAMSENISLSMGLACIHNGLSPAEVYWGTTRGAALALQLENAGKLEIGAPADVIVFGCQDYSHLPYHMGVSHARTVLKRGVVVSEHDIFCR